MKVYICTGCGLEFTERDLAIAHRRRTGHTLMMEGYISNRTWTVLLLIGIALLIYGTYLRR